MARRVLQPLLMLDGGGAGAELWAIIVAGGGRSRVGAALDRIAPLVAAERIVVVVVRSCELAVRRELGEWEGRATVLVQPSDRGSGPGLVLPLAWIRDRDPAAQVVVLPADQEVDRPEVLLAAIEHARTVGELERSAVTVLAADPDGPETEIGWIVPGRRVSQLGVRRVQRVFERPGPELAEELLELGALWCTSIVVGAAEALWQLCLRHMPEHAERIGGCAGTDQLEDAYADLAPVSFSRAVLERAGDLLLVPLRGAGWRDASAGAGGSRRTLDDLLQQIALPARGRALA